MRFFRAFKREIRTTTARRCENRICREEPTIRQNCLPVVALGRILVLRNGNGRCGDSMQRRIPYASNRQSRGLILRWTRSTLYALSQERERERERKGVRLVFKPNVCLSRVPRGEPEGIIVNLKRRSVCTTYRSFGIGKLSEFTGWSRCR